MTPNQRRAVRTIVHTLGALWMLGVLTYAVYAIPSEKLLVVCIGLIAILFVRELLHGAENVTARVTGKFGIDGTEFSVDPHKGPDK